MIKLSIIIPHYNAVNTLKKLFDSIPAESEIEIIVVDDRSTKYLESLNTLKQNYGDNPRILFLKNNKERKGAGTCRNIGIEHAQGKWLLFADADDFFVNNFYATVSEYFNTANDVIFFPPTSIETDTGNKADRHLKYSHLVDEYKNKRDARSELKLRYEFSSPCSKIIRRSFINKNNIRFDEVIASNDVMFSIKVGHLMKKFDVSKEVIYCITRSRGSLTVNLSEDVFDARLRVHINRLNFLKSKLKKSEMEVLQFKKPSFFITKAFKSKLGFRKMIHTFILFKKNNIKVFQLKHFKYLNPFNLFRLKKNIDENHRRSSRYYVKKN